MCVAMIEVPCTATFFLSPEQDKIADGKRSYFVDMKAYAIFLLIQLSLLRI